MESSLVELRTEHVGADRITTLATRRTIVLPSYKHVLARRQLKLSALGYKADLLAVEEIDVANQSMPSCIELTPEQLKLSAFGCKADLQAVEERFNPAIEVANQSMPSCIELTPERNDLLNSYSPTNKYILRSKKPKAKNETAVKTRRKARLFSKEEEDALTKGVKQYGIGNWKLILELYPSVFQGRTKVDLKDKWRNLKKGTK